MSISKIQEKRPAKHKYYVSMANGCIYQAMNTPGELGYEDRHPAEWRPATEDEIERYLNGDKADTQEQQFDTVNLDEMLEYRQQDQAPARVYDDSADVAAANAAAASAPEPAPVVASTSAPTTPQSAPAPAVSPLAPAVAPTAETAVTTAPAIAAPTPETPTPVVVDPLPAAPAPAPAPAARRGSNKPSQE